MKRFPKILIFLILSVFLLAGMVTSASALLITPETTFAWTGNDNSNLSPAQIAAIVGDSPLSSLYKRDVGDPDEGTFGSSYETTFSNTAADPKDAKIEYGDSPDPFIADTGAGRYLYVKDGQQDIAYYIFDLNDLNGNGLTNVSWNGTDDLVLEDFWPDQGAISHIEILGGRDVPIPEPATMLLVGFGLIGLAGFGRKKFFKK